MSLSQKCEECLFLGFLPFLADQLGFILFLVVGSGRSGPAGTSKCSPKSAGSVPESCGPGGWTQLEEGCAEPNEVKGGLEVGGGLLGTGGRGRSAHVLPAALNVLWLLPQSLRRELAPTRQVSGYDAQPS